ncbi:MAG: type IV secretion system DNA-binding domain-containing protein [Halothiobacillaceae bacterium]|nr:type IV secretion system DNA-binding domain-containing protein [Halothiobacillaceae bacterium]
MSTTRGSEILTHKSRLFSTSLTRAGLLALGAAALSAWPVFTSDSIHDELKILKTTSAALTLNFFEIGNRSESEPKNFPWERDVTLCLSLQDFARFGINLKALPIEKRKRDTLEEIDPELAEMLKTPMLKTPGGEEVDSKLGPESRLCLPHPDMLHALQKSGALAQAWAPVKMRLYFISALGGAVFVLILFIFRQAGKKAGESEKLRGAEIISVQAMKKLIKREAPSGIAFGGVELPKNALFKNLLAVGGSGSGKSQAIMHTLDSLRNAKKRAIVYDPTGEFTAIYYRPGIDVILNPADKRSEGWNLFADLRREADIEFLAQQFIPDPKGGDPFWSNSARTVLTDVIKYCAANSKSVPDIYSVAAKTPLHELHEILKSVNGNGAQLINPETAKTSQSIRGQIVSSPGLRFLQHFAEGGFSIRDFVRQEGDSWLFISSSASIHEIIKPYISVFLSIALNEAMDVPRDDLHLFFALDELASAGKIQSLDVALTQSRKYGISTMVGIQNIQQLTQVYSKEAMSIFIGGLQNKLILKTDEDETAKKLAEILGKEEVIEKSESVSFGVESVRDSSGVSSRRAERYLVMPAEIARLKPLEGFLKVVFDKTQGQVARVQIEYKKRPHKNPLFLEREEMRFNPASLPQVDRVEHEQNTPAQTDDEEW